HTAFFDRGYFNLGFGAEDFLVKNQIPYTAEFGLDIRIPWFKPVKITAPVSPANTTFVEYNLEPIDQKILPVQLNDTTNRETNDGNQILSIKTGLFSTRLLEFNQETDRGTVKVISLPKENWLSMLNAKNTNGFDMIHNECYLATFSSKSYGKDNYYLGFNDKNPQKMDARKMPQPTYIDRFKIVGRYAIGKYDKVDQTYEQDRVLVTSASLQRFDRHVSMSDLPADQYLRTGYYWVNTKDVRLVEPCSKEDFLQE
ncbi:MAG: hypothetical protein KDD37_06200, partial [Bdellovibrionales bacterium]|nr:hypothetical protein [Bdellovibrionales bacterium]